MKVDYFQSLASIVVSLKPEEVEVAKKFLIAFDQHTSNRKSNKSLQLLKLLVSKPATDFNKAWDKISPGLSQTSFDRFVRRVRERVLESLVLHINTGRKEQYCEPFRYQIKLRKMLMQVPLLFDRGIYDEAMDLRERVITDGRRYELYPELLEAVQHQLMMAAMQVDERGYELAEQDWRYYSVCRNWVELAEQWLHQLDSEKLNAPGADRIGKLKLAIHQLNRMFRITRSGRISFCRWNLKRDLALLVGDHNMAREASLSLKALIWSHPSLGAPQYWSRFQAGNKEVEAIGAARASRKQAEAPLEPVA